MSNANIFVTSFMKKLAGEVELTGALQAVFAKILAAQVVVDADTNVVNFKPGFSTLLKVLTFIATPEDKRPEAGSSYTQDAFDTAADSAATDTGLTIGGEIPTEAPSEEPTEAPSEEPTEAPSEEPTEAPSEEPTEAPSEEPTEAPSEEPTDPELPEGKTFSLTAGTDDVVNGTDKSDLFDASTLNTLQTGDIVLDSSSDDNDVLNATLTSINAEPRIQNIETVNLTGEYVSVGFDLGLSSGIKTLNLDTKIAGGTATVEDANSLNAAAINVGDNIKTLKVIALTSGTRDTVTIDANNASAVTLTGSGGPDLYAVTVAKDAELTLSTLASAGDVVGVTVAGDATIDAGVTADNAELDLNIEATAAAAEITLSDATNINAENMTLSGTQDITLKVTDGVALSDKAAGYVGTAITDSTSGTTTIKGSALATGTDFRQAVVDVVDVAGTVGAATLTINAASKLLLSGDAAGNTTVEINNADKNTTFDKGTLVVDVAESQTSALITTKGTTKGTDGTVETLLLKAAADKVTDTDKDENGFHESTITLADVQLGAATTALVVNGDENLLLSKVTVSDDDQVVTASNMTGNLTIASMVGAFDATIIGGAGNDTITTGLAQVYDIQTGAGNDYVDIRNAAAGTKVTTGAGNDTIISSTNSTTIDAGAGDDTITANGNDTITLGDGADNVKLADNVTGTLIKDFVKGTDKVTLTSVTTANVAIDLSNVAVTDGLYAISDDNKVADVAGEWSFKLQNAGVNLSATDLRDSIAISGVTLAAGTTNILGSHSDSVNVAANETATITTGAGSDSVTVNVGSIAKTTATVKDFTVGEDTILVSGTSEADLSLNLNNVAASSGTYTIGGSTATSGAAFKLENGGSNINTEDNLTSIVQLSNFTAVGITKAVSVTGGVFNDSVILTSQASDGVVTYNFSNNGGVDTITLTNAKGGERLNFDSLTGIDSAQGIVEKAAGAAKTADATDGAVYIFADSANGAGSSKVTTFGLDAANGYTQDVVDAEVAAFINANMGVSAGESYVVIINDNSTAAYRAKGTYTNPGATHDAYAYKVTGSADGVQATNVTLIGKLDAADGIIDAKDITGGTDSSPVSDTLANLITTARKTTAADKTSLNDAVAITASDLGLGEAVTFDNLDAAAAATTIGFVDGAATLTAAQLDAITSAGVALTAADVITVTGVDGTNLVAVTGVLGADDTIVLADNADISEVVVGGDVVNIDLDAETDITVTMTAAQLAAATLSAQAGDEITVTGVDGDNLADVIAKLSDNDTIIGATDAALTITAADLATIAKLEATGTGNATVTEIAIDVTAGADVIDLADKVVTDSGAVTLTFADGAAALTLTGVQSVELKDVVLAGDAAGVDKTTITVGALETAAIGTAFADTFVLDAAPTATAIITSFTAGAGADVLDFSAFIATLGTTQAHAGTAETAIAKTNTVVTINAGVAITGKDYGNAEFAELFSTGSVGGFLDSANATAGVSSKNVVVVQGTDLAQIYFVENDVADAAIVAGEVTLVGTVDVTTGLIDANFGII